LKITKAAAATFSLESDASVLEADAERTKGHDVVICGLVHGFSFELSAMGEFI
jgi:hypothetical protein